MNKLKLNKKIRITIIVSLLILAIVFSFVNYTSYQGSLPRKVLAGYRLDSQVSFVSKGLLKAYPLGNETLIGYKLINVTKEYVGLTTYATLKPNYLYGNASIVYNQSYYFLKLIKILYLKVNITNVSYQTFVSTQYYSKLITTNFSKEGVIPINVSEYLYLNSRIENETGVYLEPFIKVVVNNSVIALIDIEGNTAISVNLIDNKIVQKELIPVFGKTISLSQYPLSQLSILNIYLGAYPRLLNVSYTSVENLDNFNFSIYKGDAETNISLNITKYYLIAENITTRYDLTPSNPIIYLFLKVKTSNGTLYPYFMIADESGMIAINIYNNSLFSPTYRVISHPYQYSYMSGVAIPLALIAFLLLFSSGINQEEKKIILNKINKYKKIIVHTENFNFSDKKIIRIKAIDELVKLALQLGKPILFKDNKLWIEETDSIYLVEI